MRQFTKNNRIVHLMYVLENGDTNEYKIGITNDLNRRLSSLQTGCPNELKIIKLWQHTDRKQIQKYERVLHRYYEKVGCRIRKNGEWFRLTQADINFLNKPTTVLEQNQVMETILEMM